LVAETVSDSTFSEFDCECGTQVLATHNANHVNVPESVPVQLSANGHFKECKELTISLL
jgi:hypothetical protein